MYDIDYLDVNFNTFKEKAIEILKNSDTFKDYNFEGSNISILIELLAYLAEINTFYQNKIAQNVYLESADLYDVVHKLAKQNGYYPKGYISSYTTLTMNISGYFSPGDQIYIPSYSSFFTEENIQYLTTKDYTFNVPTSATDDEYNVEFDVKEGNLTTLNFTGEDLIDYRLILPNQNFDHDNNNSNTHESIKVLINDEKWTRVENFYENISNIEINDNVYIFEYTKDKLYNISFSPTRNFPNDTDIISLYLIESSGSEGVIGANTLTKIEDLFVENLTNGQIIPIENLTVTNNLASNSGSNPESIDIIKNNANNIFNSQYRCVTKNDYKTYFETRNDVIKAHVWGEQEISTEGNIQEYNKIHISVIPNFWGSSTITQTTSAWTPEWTSNPIDINIPTEFSQNFKNILSNYIEPRSMIIGFLEYELPKLIYFYFEIGIKIKSTYNFANVARDVKNKILYYFSSVNRNFNEIIDFRDIINYIKDENEISPTDSFSLVKGLNYIVFRDIQLNKTIYDYESDNFPNYTMDDFDLNIDNTLRPIQLGLNQFPVINENLIIINNEG